MQIGKMLVTGAAGMVGSYVAEIFGDLDLTLTDVVGDFQYLDVRDPKMVLQAALDEKPDVILHLAAATDVDRCEREPDWAYHMNTIGTQNIALACQACGCIPIYISTAAVFWGDKAGPYTEFDKTEPMNTYGRSKLNGEKILMSLCNQYYVVRAGWMIGGGSNDKKFVGFMTRKIIDDAKKLTIVNDKFGSPTYAKDLLTSIRWLIQTKYFGLYHMVNSGSVSRYEICKEIAKILNNIDIELVPVSSAHFPLSAPRGRSEAMRNAKLDMLGAPPMPTWQEALKEYITEELLPLFLTAD
jgi:dTDP-4-dehydrorhamnose reductase